MGEKRTAEFLYRKLNGSILFEDLGIERRIILKWILQK
jgi:hypothetical protein